MLLRNLSGPELDKLSFIQTQAKSNFLLRPRAVVEQQITFAYCYAWPEDTDLL